MVETVFDGGNIIFIQEIFEKVLYEILVTENGEANFMLYNYNVNMEWTKIIQHSKKMF